MSCVRYDFPVLKFKSNGGNSAKSHAESILIETYIVVMMRLFSSIKRFGNGFLEFMESYLFSRRLIFMENMYPKPISIFSFYTDTPPITQ